MAEFKKKYKTKFARLIEALTSSTLPACAPQRAPPGAVGKVLAHQCRKRGSFSRLRSTSCFGCYPAGMPLR
jgi:hypothetical protein